MELRASSLPAMKFWFRRPTPRRTRKAVAGAVLRRGAAIIPGRLEVFWQFAVASPRDHSVLMPPRLTDFHVTARHEVDEGRVVPHSRAEREARPNALC